MEVLQLPHETNHVEAVEYFKYLAFSSAYV